MDRENMIQFILRYSSSLTIDELNKVTLQELKEEFESLSYKAYCGNVEELNKLGIQL